jgi:thiamine biosynthesis protein ThiS
MRGSFLLKGRDALEIVVNGERRAVAEGATVRSLLGELCLPESRVAVERNRALVRKAEYAGTALSEGDRVEIVTFVGGG